MSTSRPQYGPGVQQRVVNVPVAAPSAVPFVPLAEIQRAVGLHQQGRLNEAEAVYLRVLGKLPAQFDCLHYLGLLRHQQGRSPEAIDLIRRALGVNDADPSAHCNLGLVLHVSGRPEEALASYDRAIALNGRFALALGNRGNVLRDLGRFAESIDSYEKACALAPHFIDAHLNCARLLQSTGRFADALRHYDSLVALAPGADFYNARGCMQRLLFRHEEALASFEQAIGLDAAHFDAWCNKASTHFILGQQQAANDAFDACVRLAPASAEARLKRLIMRIPAVRGPGDDIDRIRDGFSRDLAQYADWLAGQDEVDALEVVGSAQPFYLAYQERPNRDLLVSYGRICNELMARWSAQNGVALRPAPRAPGARIRVGVVSAHFSNHPVWTAIVKGWFGALDRNRFELHAFDLGTAEDAQTAVAKSAATAYHRGARPLLEWARLIASSNIDVLIYPELGMDQTTAQLAALRLARRQGASWGHPETTGLPTIDVYFSAAAFEDVNAQEYYSERLVTLPNLGCCYDPPAVAPAQIEPAAFGIRPGAALFVCPGSPFKYAPEHDHALVDIAKRVENAQFLFFTNPRLPDMSAAFQARIASAFRAAGLEPAGRLLVIPWQSPPEFYAIMREAHVFLDTVGFSGFNTAMQAIDCGLPIVTVEGRFMRGRFASAILKRIGLDELVHADTRGYVDSACRIASDTGYREALKESIRARRAILYGDAAPIRALEDTLERLCAEP